VDENVQPLQVGVLGPQPLGPRDGVQRLIVASPIEIDAGQLQLGERVPGAKARRLLIDRDSRGALGPVGVPLGAPQELSIGVVRSTQDDEQASEEKR
jgi:hypothetical protein